MYGVDSKGVDKVDQPYDFIDESNADVPPPKKQAFGFGDEADFREVDDSFPFASFQVQNHENTGFSFGNS